MFNFQLLAGAVLGALILAAGGYYTGYTQANNSHKAAMLDKEREERRAYAALIDRNNALAQELENVKKERNAVFRKATKKLDEITQRDVYHNTCIDDDGMFAVNSALAGKTADPNKSPAAMSRSDAAGGSDGSRPDSKAGGGRMDVLRLR